jgi:hypothetical protein
MANVAMTATSRTFACAAAMRPRRAKSWFRSDRSRPRTDTREIALDDGSSAHCRRSPELSRIAQSPVFAIELLGGIQRGSYGPRTPNTAMNVRYEHPVRTRCERDYRDAVDGSYPNLTTARVLPCRPVRRDDALPAGNTPSRKDGGRTACSKRCPASDIFQAGCGIVSRGPGQLVFNTEPPSTANVAGTEPRG